MYINYIVISSNSHHIFVAYDPKSRKKITFFFNAGLSETGSIALFVMEDSSCGFIHFFKA